MTSPTFGQTCVVCATSTLFLEKAEDNEKTRKDRGVAFSPDGRYCYVTSHSPAGLYIFQAPTNFNGSFVLERSFMLPHNKFADLQEGNDGYLYLGDYDYSKGCFRRLNMYAPVAEVFLEDYVLPGWTSSPHKKPIPQNLKC